MATAASKRGSGAEIRTEMWNESEPGMLTEIATVIGTGIGTDTETEIDTVMVLGKETEIAIVVTDRTATTTSGEETGEAGRTSTKVAGM